MHFPVTMNLGGMHLPVHILTDVLAYSIGFRIYLACLRRMDTYRPDFEQKTWIFLGCVFGALLGAKVLALAENGLLHLAQTPSAATWTGGKTIVGALLGGWAGIECAKRCLGIRRSTGDAIVPALVVGIAIGRVGCFLTGLADQTFGTATSLPWGVDFGDGIHRHPTQVYEILFLGTLGSVLWIWRRHHPRPEGVLFRAFLTSYLLFRFTVDFIKPHLVLWAGLSPIQWTCLLGTAVAVASWMGLRARTAHQPENSHA